MTIPVLPTVEQLRDYCDSHVQAGRGKFRPMLDQRGLGFIQPQHHGKISIGIPPDGETHDEKTNRVFFQGKYGC